VAGKKIQEAFCWKIRSDNLIIYIATSKKGAFAVSLSLRDDMDCTEYFKEIFPYKKIIKSEKTNIPLIKALNNALIGRPYLNQLILDISLTPFQQMVLEETAKIPYGQTKTYGDIAWIVGKPGGARAIGQVMNKNPLPLIFPCHRVVAANGIGGFNGGIELKRHLLEKETKYHYG